MNDTVEKMMNLRLNGNVIDHNWYTTLTIEGKDGKGGVKVKPFHEAITILAEIVYWYRPTIIKCEADGRITSIKRKFKSDLLQKSYSSLSNQFGYSKQKTKESIKYLEDEGVITRVFRTIRTENDGLVLSNVMFIQLNFERLLEKSTNIAEISTPPLSEIETQVCSDSRQTYTETTTETTTKNKKNTKKVNNSRPSNALEVEEYGKSIGFRINGSAFIDHYEAIGWVRGRARTPIKSWKACVRTWKNNNYNKADQKKVRTNGFRLQQ